MHALPRSFRVGGFTLIELLVVIAIIAILVGLLFPAYKGVQDQAKRTQAKNDLTQIVTAVNAFYTEYGKYPLVTADTIYGPGGTSSADLFYSLHAVALGANAPVNGAPAVNPRAIVFISPPDVKDTTNPRSGIGTDGQYYDPWGTPYVVTIDGDYDNQIANPYSDSDGSAGAVQLRFGVIAYSVGKNGALGGGAAASSKYAAESGTAGKYKDSSDVISWQ
jgi:prepilin-type N-terminal cleavage/methylation domain-containing protein